MPEWPMSRRRVHEIARHYGDEVPWFRSDLQQDDEARLNIRGAFSDILSIAEWLYALDLGEGQAPVVKWVGRGGPGSEEEWKLAVSWAETCLNSKVWNLIEVTDQATREEPLYAEPGVAEHERGFWPDGAVPARPGVDPLFRDGLMTQEWIDYLKALAGGFEALADEMCEMHETVTAARSLLFRGFFLCMDLAYVGRAMDYAWHLHATEEDRPSEAELIKGLRQMRDDIRDTVKLLEELTDEECPPE